MRTRRLLAIAVSLAVVASACGSAESGAPTTSLAATTTTTRAPATTAAPATSTTTTTTTITLPKDPQTLVDAIVAFELDDPDNQFSFEELTCVAESTVGVVGLEALAAGGITVDQPDLDASDFQPTAEQADAFADALFECMDVGDLLVSSFLTAEDAPSFFTEASVRCLGDGMEESDVFKDLVAKAILSGDDQENPFADDPEAAAVLIDLMFDCLDFAEIFLASFPPEAAISEESVLCLGDGMERSTAFRNLLVESMLGDDVDPFADPESGAEILQLVLDCFSAEEILQLSQLDG